MDMVTEEDNDDSKIKRYLNVSSSPHRTISEKVLGKVPKGFLCFCENEVFTFPLSKDTRDETKACEMFGEINRYMKLPNDQRSAESKMTCVDRIIDFQRCEQLSSKEIAFQFIKQTRKNPELFWTRNVWKLFGVLMEKMGEIDFGEVSQWLLKKVESAAFRNNDPVIRLMAFGVYRALKGEETTTDLTQLQLQIRSVEGMTKISKIHIYCKGEELHVYTDSNTTIPDAIEQLIWSQGLNKRDEYDLYGELSENNFLIIGHAMSFEMVAIERKDEEFKHFVLRKKFSRLTKIEKEQPYAANESYVHSSGRYHRGRYKTKPAIATQLCLFRILAEGRKDALGSMSNLVESIDKYFPEKVFIKRLPVEWARDVLNFYSYFGETTVDDAKRWFLQNLRCLCCESFLDCIVTAKKGFDINYRENSELFLKVSCTGLYFFLPNQADNPPMHEDSEIASPVEIIDFMDLGPCQLKGNTFHFKAVVRGVVEKKFEMEMIQGKELMNAVNAHSNKNDRENVLRTFRRTHSHQIETNNNSDSETEDDVITSSSHINSAQATRGTTHHEQLAGPSQLGNRQVVPQDEKSSNRSEDKDVTDSYPELSNIGIGKQFGDKYEICDRLLRPRLLCAVNINSHDRVVLKFFQKETLWKRTVDAQRALGDKGVLKIKFVCKMIDVFDIPPYPKCIAFEFGDYSLKDLMLDASDNFTKKAVFREILECLNEIHQRGIVHGDVTPSNFMFFTTLHRWKLIDFEFAGREGEDVAVGYTARYAAPEIVHAIVEQKSIKLRSNSDMFSAGVIGYELFTGKRYYGNKEKGEIDQLHRINSALPRLEVEDDSIRSLLKNLIRKEPHKRYSAQRTLEKSTFLPKSTSSKIPVRPECSDSFVNARIRVDPKNLNELRDADLVIGMTLHEANSDAIATTDQLTEQQPLFLVSSAESHCLSIRLTFIETAVPLIKGIYRVRLTFPEEGAEAIDAMMSDYEINGTELTTVATIEGLHAKLLKLDEEEHGVREFPNKLHRIDVSFHIGTSDNDKNKGFDVFKEKLYVQRVQSRNNPDRPKFMRNVIGEWRRPPHLTQNLESDDLTCGMIIMKLASDVN